MHNPSMLPIQIDPHGERHVTKLTLESTIFANFGANLPTQLTKTPEMLSKLGQGLWGL